MEILRSKRILAPVLAIAMVGNLSLSACGGSDSGEPEAPKAAEVDANVENDPDLKNYRIVELNDFHVSRGSVLQDVVTLQESYDYQGKHWECSISVSDGNKSGGVAKSCVVTSLQQG
jgi:hypothetical protein